MTIKRFWGHFAVCALAVVVATAAMAEGYVWLWVANCVVFLINAYYVLKLGT